MAIIVMVYGQSGTGKSASLRNFSPEDVAVINVSGKPLPFRGGMKTYNTDDYKKIENAIHKTSRRSIIIDDATYLMTGEFMRTAKVFGYQKFTDMALNYYTLVRGCAALPKDKIIYFLGHSEIDADGREKFKTIGRMLDEKITLEGLYAIVLKTFVQDGKYFFATHNDGNDTVKTPMGMFEQDYIDNDLAAVDAVIRGYYGLPDLHIEKEGKLHERALS